jgi:sulfide:quinone oxidoreductase
MTDTTTPRRVLIAGGGVAALEALMALEHLAGTRIDRHLIAASTDFVYRPLLVAEPFGAEEEAHRLPLAGIARDLGAGHVTDAITAVDIENRRVSGASGSEYRYDALLVATGARFEAAVPGSVTFHGPAGAAAVRGLLTEVRAGTTERIAFIVPPGPTWPLPVYELAMMTAAWAWNEGFRGAQIALITPERRPLAAFGDSAADAMEDLLRRHAIEFHGGATAATVHEGAVRLTSGDTVPADAAVATPRLHGPGIAGLPVDADGFIRADDHGRVDDAPGVFAAGDAAAWTIKHGGLAAQQADAAAESIAAWAGAPVRPKPFQAVLRGVVMAGDERLFVRADTREHRTRSIARLKPLWWPPAKVAGRYLAPYLAARGIRVPETPAPPSASLR